MKRPCLAFAALALAAGSTVAVARSGDTWSGTNRHREYASVEVTGVQPAQTVIVYDTNTMAAPLIVERSYAYQPEVVYYHEPRYVRRYSPDHDWVKDLNPQTGHRIGDGLFNREGPNDFGQ